MAATVLTYEVMAKVEAADMDGQPKYTLQGMLRGSFDGIDSDIGQLAIPAGDQLWEEIMVGDSLVFHLGEPFLTPGFKG